MNDQSNSSRRDVGIPGLPKRWAVAVQLVGTFGLAVFLVLYYVLVMHPSETERYEQLRSSVESLIKIIEGEQTLLKREQAANLERLFVLAVAPEIADRIIQGLREEVAPDELKRKLEDIMIVKTSLLQGLTRKDGGNISEMLTHKIRVSRVADRVVKEAQDKWSGLEKTQIVANCKDELEFAIRTTAMAK
jgi:hypothetical protein